MTEKRLTPEEFKQKLIEYQKSRPVVMDEREYAAELDETVVLRYKKGVELLDGIVNKLGEGAGTSLDVDMIARDVEDAIVAFGYGHMGHNRCGRANMGGHSRVILWYDPAEQG